MNTRRLLMLVLLLCLGGYASSPIRRAVAGPELPTDEISNVSVELAAAGVGNCTNTDGAFDRASFVIVTMPRAGDRVSSGFTVTGCSRTFESNVQWRLLGRDGSILNRGFTHGGGVDGVAPFQFTVEFPAVERQIGHLEVYEEDVSEGEGFPPGRTEIPLVLNP